MPHTGLDIISKHVFSMLEDLAPELTYHSVHHTEDVVTQSERIAHDEGIGEEDLYLLLVAALYHDTGFLYTYLNHEEKSCDIFLKDTDQFSFTPGEKDIILGIIRATKVPQQPHTKLERIICDADLDYLGREDFKPISSLLKKEFLHYGIVADEDDWTQMQQKFLSTHRYHTASSRRHREPVKRKHASAVSS